MKAIQYTLYPFSSSGTDVERKVRVWTYDPYDPISWDLTDSTLKIWENSKLQLVAHNVQEAKLISDYQPPATDTEGD